MQAQPGCRSPRRHGRRLCAQALATDWGQVRVRFESGPAEVRIFVMTLGFARRAWAVHSDF